MRRKFILIGIAAMMAMVAGAGYVSAAITVEDLTQLTTDSANEYNPAWSPTGDEIVFGRNADIYKVSSDGLHETQLTSNPNCEQRYKWSPDNTKIVYDKDNTNGWNDVWIMNTDGSLQTDLTNNPQSVYGVWSPDGTKIAYVHGSNYNQPLDLIIMNPDGSNKQIIATGQPSYGTCIAWSPDASKIAFSSGATGSRGIRVINADGTSLTPIASGDIMTQTQSWQTQVWSADGTKIVYHSDEDGNWDIYTINADGTGKTQLTTDTSGDRSAYFSPDGSKILFVSDRSGNSDIWVMGVDGSNKVQLTTNASVDTGPTWSPDGNKIVFQSDRSGNYDIWVMDVSDGEMTEIAYDDGEKDGAWSFGSDSGWGHGVLFNVGAPTTITKVKIYGRIYDANPSFIPPGFGETFDVEIRDSSLNKLDSVTYDYDDYFTESYDWAVIDIPDVSVDDDFYIWVNTKSFQSTDIGKGILIGEDSDSPTGNSFKIETTTDSILETWDSNWMIRALVYGAGGADTTPPELTITSHENGDTVYTSLTTVTGTASDPSGIASVTVNDVLASGAPDWSTWSAEVTLVAGENTITVVATDNAGNVATETITVYRVEPFTFVHMTDVHIGDHWVLDDECRSTPESIEKFTDTLQAIKTEDPEFILSPGDLVEWNKPDYFKAYMNILKSIDDIPVYNTPGNHDRRTWLLGGDDNLAMYYTYVTNPPNTSLNDGHRGYYFDKHGYRFIGLDTGADYNVSTSIKEPYYDYSPEGNGLKNIQLDKLSEMPSGIPKIIFMHHPAIGDGDDMLVDESPEYPITNDCLPEYGGNDACIAFHRCEFIKYCIDNNVDMVLTGHTHRDYDKTVSNELETHKTWFIQTRSATKDPEPCNHHGYRVIKITDEGIIPHMSEMTENTLKNIKRYTYIGGYFPGGVCYVRKGSDITGMDKSGDIMREIPESYYTEPIGLEYQVIVCYNSEPDEYRWCRRVSAGTSQTVVTQESTSSNITIKHRTESTTTKYIYENITLGTAENATIGINFSSENINYTMEFDDNGDGTIDNTTEPTRIIINHAPNVSIATPAGDQSGNVIISYNLVDAESDNCTIITQYSLDNTTWLYAGVGEGGDGMIDVASTPVGVDHTFVWASGTDLPHTNATVYFRIRPYDGDLAGDYATTDAFFVDNRVVPGDLNHDGILTPADAAIALELAAIGGWDPVADVNNDSHITSLDALMILQAAAETQT